MGNAGPTMPQLLQQILDQLKAMSGPPPSNSVVTGTSPTAAAGYNLQDLGFNDLVTTSGPGQVDIYLTVPGDQLWEILEVMTIYTTSAHAANRKQYLIFQSSGAKNAGSVWVSHTSPAMTATAAWAIMWVRGQQIEDTTFDTNNVTRLFMPEDTILLPGYSVGPVTTNSDTADTYLYYMKYHAWKINPTPPKTA